MRADARESAENVDTAICLAMIALANVMILAREISERMGPAR